MAEHRTTEKRKASATAGGERRSASAAAAKQAPHQPFWEAGQNLYQELQNRHREASLKLMSTLQEQQQNLGRVQLEAQKRVDELRHDYWAALNRAATAEDGRRVYQEASQKYLDALWELQSQVRKEWEGAAVSYQEAMAGLQEEFQDGRVKACADYKQALQRAWSDLDAEGLSCQGVAAISQSLWMGARVMAGVPGTT